MTQYRVYKKLEPISPAMIDKLVAEGRASELAGIAREYEKQQAMRKAKNLLLKHRACKRNKKGGIYINSPSIPMKLGCNFQTHKIETMVAIIEDPELSAMFINLARNGVEVDQWLEEVEQSVANIEV